MTTIACTQPGCSGTIMDGYCDVCGSPAPAGAVSPSAVAGAPEVATPDEAREILSLRPRA